MGYSSELKGSSPQPSKLVKEKILLPQANRSLKFQDKLKVENFISEKYVDLNHASRQNVDKQIIIQPKSSENRQKQWARSKAIKDEELVKHMSNVPRYLQRMDRGENLQEKALNFGVLNWENLEKWKYDQKPLPARGSTKSSSTSSNSLKFTDSSTISDSVQRGTHAHPSKQHSSVCSNINSSCAGGPSQGVKPSREKDISIQDFGVAPKSASDRQTKILSSAKSFGGKFSETTLGKGKNRELDEKITAEMGTSSLHLRNYGVSVSSKEMISARIGEYEKRIEDMQESDSRRKFVGRTNTSDVRASSENLRNHGTSLVPNIQTEARVGKHENIDLLSPRHVRQNSSLTESQFSTPRKSIDKMHPSFSDCFSPELVGSHSSYLYFESPHSCPLPCTVGTNNESDMKQHSLTDAHSMGRSSNESQLSSCSYDMSVTQSEGKYAKGNKFNIRPTDSALLDCSKQLDWETAKLPAKKVRHPSPNRRFSIGLGRMSRSISFKEGSAVPQLSSTYVSARSGPVSSEASSCLDNSSRDKANAANRARSSPLRRLLDPILKPKAPNQHHSAETVQPLKMKLNSLSYTPIDISGSLQNDKHKASTVHALLQFTVKNGLPLFKFVVDNNKNILAATVTKSATPVMDDYRQNYTLYSVNEIKKKSGNWMSQGSKEKSCGYVYNVAGQMKVSTSHSHDLTGGNSDQFTVRESVLFGVDPRLADQESPKFVSNRELAAVVVKIPSEESRHDRKQSNDDKESSEKGFTGYLSENRCFSNLGENNESYSTTVILPGSVHGLPNIGGPSPLLERWRSGGSCDCGGWDLGCNLCILSTKDGCCKSSGESKACVNPDRFELFVQGGAQESKPYFSLAPFKNDIYSVEFKASISLLQAFSICVALKSCQDLSHISEMSRPAEARRLFREQTPPLNGDDTLKVPTSVQGEIPAKFVSYPPLSPVGRA